MNRVLHILAVLVTLLFPLALWLGEGRVAPVWLAGLLLLAVSVRLPAAASMFLNRYWAGGAVVLAGLAFWFDAALPLKFYPVLVNALLLALFAYSLVEPPSMIERLARLREANLPPAAVVYTRRVTQVWCGFFAVNGTIALYTALFASMAQWSFYNGFLAYLFVGLLFAGEYCARCWFKRRHGSTAQSA